MVLPLSFSNMIEDRAPSCNKIPYNLSSVDNFPDGIGPTTENPLLLYHCKSIVWIDQQAPSPGQVVLLLLATTQVYKLGDHKPHCQFHGVASI